MVSVYDHLISVFTVAISSAYPNLQNIQTVISVGVNPKFGDYQCNSSMQITKALQAEGIKFYIIQLCYLMFFTFTYF